MTHSFAASKAWLSGLGLALAAVGSAQAASLDEHFDYYQPTGWTIVNNSDPLGTISWVQGNDGIFSSQDGIPTAYVATSFAAGAATSQISNWLITPTLSFDNGDTLSFWTRTDAGSTYPDALEVRFSAVGGVDVGSTSSSVGTFTSVLVSINPTLSVGGYPESWTQYTYTFSGLSGATSGALAFRYVVADGGPGGTASNYIGIDAVQVTPVPEPASWLLLAAGLGAFALRRRVGRD